MKFLKKPFIVFISSDLHQIYKNRVLLPKFSYGYISALGIKVLIYILSKKVISKSNEVLFLSKKIQKNYIKTGINKKGKVFRTSLVSKILGKKNKIYKSSVITFIFLGRIIADKGLDDIISICKYFEKKGIIVRFHLVGDGLQRQNFKNNFLTNMKNGKLFEHGWINDQKTIRSILRISDFCLLPSKNEGTPKIIFESMAAGCIFVGSNTGGISEIIQDMSNGIILNSNAVVKNCKKLFKVHSDDKLKNLIRKNAFNFVKNFTKKKTVNNLCKHIDKIYKNL